MSRAIDQWTLEQAAKKQFATLTSEQQMQAANKVATQIAGYVNSSCERMMMQEGKVRYKRKKK